MWFGFVACVDLTYGYAATLRESSGAVIMRVANAVEWVTSVVWSRRQTLRNRQQCPQLRLEHLEARDVPTINPTGLEQEMMELLNHMRMDPAGELNRLLVSTNPIQARDPEVQAALQYFGVSGSALASQFASLTAAQPLAWSDGLMTSSRTHNQLMITDDSQSHQLPGEADVGTRITAAGYSNWTALGENIYAYSDTVAYGHAGFAIDWGFGTNGLQSPAGHRINMMNNSYREVGISVINETNPSTEVGPLVITQDFGARSNQGNSYLLGVVYSDSNSNNSYNAGEGLGGVTVSIVGSAGSFTTTTMSAGGYQLQVPSGSYTVTFSGGGLSSPITKSVTVGSTNAKVDGVAGQTGNPPPPPPPSNHAPVLDASFVATLSTIAKGATNPAGVSVASIVGNSITDADANAQQGIAIYNAVNTNGQWQYSLNSGTTWTAFGTASSTAARLLRSSDLVRFVPNATFTGSAAITYVAWDQTTGTAGGTANISTITSIGGSTAFSSTYDYATVNVIYTNYAPVLNTSGTFTLPYVKANSTAPTSVLVSTLLGTNVTDANAGALKGLAITAIDNTRGNWQYTTNAGTNWYNVPTTLNNTALLLRSTDYLRFYPKAGNIGISSMVFRAWDRTTGTAGTVGSLASGVGGNTSFSADQVFANVQVGNNAPVLNTTNPFTLNAFTNGNTTNPGTLISTLLGQNVTDVDMNSQRGIAIIGLTGTTTGTWQYSTNSGTTWNAINSIISSSSALLLRSQDLIRYVPKSTFHGSVSLQFRAWDQMSGVVGTLVNLAATRTTTPFGGNSSYSSEFGSATLQVV
ncbi:MAG TPA: CAP domain-containing protein [Gemmatales bacterium]|nr:CAP domain-containing protein [Gemmatales bacterium]